MKLDIEKIKKLIPHRYPFLFLDWCDIIEPGKEGIGFKKFLSDEYFFKGLNGLRSIKKQIIKRILMQNNWSPNRLLMVGDALTDWEGAKQSKVCFMGIKRDRKLADPASEHSIKNIHELCRLI